ncbi:MAG: hypothetical protein ACOCRX_04480 [Candidatus Woesearchaeota archaeon]
MKKKIYFCFLLIMFFSLIACQVYNFEERSIEVMDKFFQSLNNKDFKEAKKLTLNELHSLINDIQKSNKKFKYENLKYTIEQSTNDYVVIKVFGQLNTFSKTENVNIQAILVLDENREVKIHNFMDI